MEIHQNARLLPRMRAALVERILAGEPVKRVVAEFHVTERTARKWLKRYREEGVAGLTDRVRPLGFGAAMSSKIAFIFVDPGIAGTMSHRRRPRASGGRAAG